MRPRDDASPAWLSHVRGERESASAPSTSSPAVSIAARLSVPRVIGTRPPNLAPVAPFFRHGTHVRETGCPPESPSSNSKGFGSPTDTHLEPEVVHWGYRNGELSCCALAGPEVDQTAIRPGRFARRLTITCETRAADSNLVARERRIERRSSSWTIRARRQCSLGRSVSFRRISTR